MTIQMNLETLGETGLDIMEEISITTVGAATTIISEDNDCQIDSKIAHQLSRVISMISLEKESGSVYQGD